MNYKTELINEIKEVFQSKFGGEGRVFFAPSRINIIGEHIDYNGGKVLPCAIEIGTYGMAKKNDLNTIRAYSITVKDGGQVELTDLEFNKSKGWLNYLSGMVKFIKEKGHKVEGFDLVISGNIPTGSGLSSSASLEMLIGEVINSLFKLGISREDMSILGMKVENDHLGLKTGIMDQFAISLGKEDSAILLDTSSLDYKYINVDLGDNILVILNTNKPRSLVESKYNERRSQTQKALSIIKEYINIDDLCKLDINTYQDYLMKIEDKTIFNRARHVVEENQRVKEMILAMENSDYEKMGDILNKSHYSLKDLYEVTGSELDAITEGARRVEGCYGARMTGAGFSGCGIALVKKEALDNFTKEVKSYYKEKTGLDADIILSNIVDGPREIL